MEDDILADMAARLQILLRLERRAGLLATRGEELDWNIDGDLMINDAETLMNELVFWGGCFKVFQYSPGYIACVVQGTGVKDEDAIITTGHHYIRVLEDALIEIARRHPGHEILEAEAAELEAKHACERNETR